MPTSSLLVPLLHACVVSATAWAWDICKTLAQLNAPNHLFVLQMEGKVRPRCDRPHMLMQCCRMCVADRADNSLICLVMPIELVRHAEEIIGFSHRYSSENCCTAAVSR